MKDNVKASLGTGLYVGAVYLIGSYLAYRAGKEKGALDTHIEYISKELDEKLAGMKEKHPEYFEDEEAQ